VKRNIRTLCTQGTNALENENGDWDALLPLSLMVSFIFLHCHQGFSLVAITCSSSTITRAALFSYMTRYRRADGGNWNPNSAFQ
jgi:hypothetical protein